MVNALLQFHESPAHPINIMTLNSTHNGPDLLDDIGKSRFSQYS
jgi:hypothetical protein